MGLVARLFVIAGVLFILPVNGCEDGSAQQTAVSSSQPQPVEASNSESVQPIVRGADITLEWEERDFGTIWDFEKVTTTFPFTNNGTKPLVLSKLQAGCGCTTPVADKTILQPGESGTITVIFNPKGKSKKQDKKVTIFSNAVGNPQKVFWIRSYVNTFVGIDKRFLELGEMQLGVPHSVEFDFTPVDPDFVITSMVGSGKHGQFVTAEELDMPAGSSRRIRINVSPDMPWGAFHSQMIIKGRGTTLAGELINYSFTMFANGKAFGQLKVDQQFLSLGTLKQGDAYHKRIHLFHVEGVPFKVIDTTVLKPTVAGINTTAVQMLDGSYEIIVSGTLPLDHRGTINGEIMVQTDVLGEEILKIRLAGVGPRK